MKTYSGQAIADSNGNAEADITPPNGYFWSATHLSVESNSAALCSVSVFLNQRFVCGSSVGNQDSADGSPIPVKSGDQLRFVWASCTPGAVCNAQAIVMEGLTGGIAA